MVFELWSLPIATELHEVRTGTRQRRVRNQHERSFLDRLPCWLRTRRYRVPVLTERDDVAHHYREVVRTAFKFEEQKFLRQR